MKISDYLKLALLVILILLFIELKHSPKEVYANSGRWQISASSAQWAWIIDQDLGNVYRVRASSSSGSNAKIQKIGTIK